MLPASESGALEIQAGFPLQEDRAQYPHHRGTPYPAQQHWEGPLLVQRQVEGSV